MTGYKQWINPPVGPYGPKPDFKKVDMSVYCSWCDKHMSGPEVEDHKHGPEDVSHGMCTSCAEKEIEKDERNKTE